MSTDLLHLYEGTVCMYDSYDCITEILQWFHAGGQLIFSGWEKLLPGEQSLCYSQVHLPGPPSLMKPQF